MSGVLLFDGDCGFCTASANWLQRHAISAAQVVPWQQADLSSVGLSEKQVAKAVHWVEGDDRAAGVAAISAYLQTSTPPWRRIGRLLVARGPALVTRPLYRFIARHSDRLPGGIPANDLPRIAKRDKGIRRRRSKHLGGSVRLLRVVYSEGQYPYFWPDSPRRWLAGDDVIEAWVAERSGDIHGHVAIARVGQDDAVAALRWREITGHVVSDLAQVSRFFVRPRDRRQGVGSALLEVAEAEIRARGLLPVMEVVSSNTEAIDLFEKRGWRLIATHTWGEKEDHLRLFWYELPPDPRGH